MYNKYKVSKLSYKDFSIQKENVISETEKFVTLEDGRKEAKDTKDYYVYCNSLEEAAQVRKETILAKISEKEKTIAFAYAAIEQLKKLLIHQ
jgi:hypothetical protein